MIRFQYGGWRRLELPPKSIPMLLNEPFVCPGTKDWNIYSKNAVSGVP